MLPDRLLLNGSTSNALTKGGKRQGVAALGRGPVRFRPIIAIYMEWWFFVGRPFVGRLAGTRTQAELGRREAPITSTPEWREKWQPYEWTQSCLSRPVGAADRRTGIAVRPPDFRLGGGRSARPLGQRRRRGLFRCRGTGPSAGSPLLRHASLDQPDCPLCPGAAEGRDAGRADQFCYGWAAADAGSALHPHRAGR
jgi:hypothetical protein